MNIVPAYKQITEAERAIVDALVQWYESESDRRGERLLETFKRPVPDDLYERSRGLLDRPLVSAAVSERVIRLAQERELSQERVLRELMAIAFTNPAELMQIDPDGEISWDIHAASNMHKAAIKTFDYEESGDGLSRPGKRRVKLQFHDKIAALKMLSEITGLTSGENTHYHIARSDASEIIDAEMTTEAAGDIYAALIEGD